MLFVGMRFLDFTNKRLVWGQEAVLPFFLLHQPVIIVIAYYVVQWNTGYLPEADDCRDQLAVVTLALYEFVIRRIGFLRTIFGMKATAKPSGAQPRVGNSDQSETLADAYAVNPGMVSLIRAILFSIVHQGEGNWGTQTTVCEPSTIRRRLAPDAGIAMVWLGAGSFGLFGPAAHPKGIGLFQERSQLSVKVALPAD